MPALSLLLCLAGSAAASEGVPKDVAAYLRNVAAFAPDRLAALESGEAIAKIAADEDGQITIIGAVRVRTTKDHVESYFDVYLKHEDGALVLRVGRFGRPAVLEDLGRLELEQDDIDALRNCRPGDCGVQVGAGVAGLQAAVDWRAPDAAARAQALVRQRLLDYVRAYQEKGDAALVTYTDTSRPVPLAARWKELLRKAVHLYEYAPQLQRYLVEYPRLPLAGTTDFIQWSKVDQGLKPVVLVTHVVQHKDPAKPDRITFALKQIYASRYYEAAFSLASVVESPQNPEVCYVVFANRSRLDVLRGTLGGVKRRVTANEVLKATQLTLGQIRDALERAAGPR
jgi:hypothetical protein